MTDDVAHHHKPFSPEALQQALASDRYDFTHREAAEQIVILMRREEALRTVLAEIAEAADAAASRADVPQPRPGWAARL